jgi:hypothetical protein
MDEQVDELQALVRQSREEQAVISSKILALKSGGTANTPALRGGFGSPGGDEVRALREQLVETDSLLLERDAEVENLREQVQLMKVHFDEPKTGAAWRGRYEEAQKRTEGWEKDYQALQAENGQKQREVVNLSAYLRILEVDKEVNAQQRERLLTDANQVRSNVRVLQVERDTLQRQLRALEEGFLRCIGRVTQSLASGVATVIINDKSPEARFVVLRLGSGGNGVDASHGIIEIFREPDAHDEVAAMDLSIAAGATASVDKQAMTVLLTESAESTLRICCVSMEEFLKWSGAVRLIGFDLKQ